jgi:DNA-binding MarR family transcriptional regulator
MASATKQTEQDHRVAAVRAFNRFYTRQLGFLGQHYLDSPFTLTEGRMIYELANGTSEVADLREDLGLDAGYVSRILDRFERMGLIARERSSEDRRRQIVKLTARGRAAFRTLDRRSSKGLAAMLGGSTDEQQRRLVEAMSGIRRILGEPLHQRRVEVRAAGPGDHGWVLERHAHLYDDDLGWPPEFEALVAGILAEFLADHDPKRERVLGSGARRRASRRRLLREQVRHRRATSPPLRRGLGAGAWHRAPPGRPVRPLRPREGL